MISETSNCVTIRTTNNSEQSVINITLEVEDGEIISMSGLDGDGRTWEVERIQFHLADAERQVVADRCCIRTGGVTICMEC